MKIDLTKIEFTEDEMIEILQDNGYRVEGHVGFEFIPAKTMPVVTTKKINYAVPIGETFDGEVHDTVEKTFEALLMSQIKKTIVTSFKIPPRFQ